MNNLIAINDIENKIYEVRGKQVMLDSDLALLYKCKNGTKTINQAVNRHLDRFPNDFYFQLTEEEYMIIINSSRSQFGTLNKSRNNRGYNIKYLPYVFTEQGVAMLVSVLRTDIAAKMSINIMRAFVLMHHYLIDNHDINKSLTHINNKLIEHDEKFDYLFNKFDKKDIYHSGTSINNVGNRLFNINKLEDIEIKNLLIEKIIKKELNVLLKSNY